MKILVIQQKMIGDVLTSSILFEALRKEFPEAQLHYLVFSHTIPVLENNPFINKVILYNENMKSSMHFLEFFKQIRKEKYDIVIDVYAKIGSGVISRFTNAELRVSFNKWYTKFLYTHSFSRNITPKTNAGQAIEKRLKLLTPIMDNIPVDIKPKIYLTSKELSTAKEKLDAAGVSDTSLLLMISVLGSSNTKTYPLDYLAKILDLLVAQTGAKLLFNYIPSQKDDALKIYNLCKSETQKSIFIELFGHDLREFLALTSHCNALIGNEGGAVNMAKAMNVPTFAIFSPGVPKENWNMYEDGKTNVSVHLKDYMPELFDEQSNKNIRKNSKELYSLFKPDFFEEKLLNFVNPCFNISF
jgi:heptosyltransferase-2